MNILLWVLQVALAWFCVAGGVFQIFKIDDLKTNVASMRALPRGIWAGLGAVSCLAGLGLLVPGFLVGFPNLTAVSAIVVAVQSIFICGVYGYFRDFAPLPYSAVMAILAGFIAYGRFCLSPF